jgi:ribosomal protein S18 acetylase RimI-like enzyme
VSSHRAAEITLRTTEVGDDALQLRVYASTRADELALVPWSREQKEAFVAQQFAAQTAHYARHYPQMSADVILVDGEPAGRLLVARLDDEILIVDIALLPEHRGAGVGTALLHDVLAEADAAGKRVAIHVERFNPALRLYERLGFSIAEDQGVYLLLERRPAT